MKILLSSRCCMQKLNRYLFRCDVPEKKKVIPIGMAFFFYPACVASPERPPGYEDDERSSLGKRGDCRRWREKGAERSAAVCVQRSRTIGKAHTGHRKPGGRTDAEKLSGQAHIESCLRNQ